MKDGIECIICGCRENSKVVPCEKKCFWVRLSKSAKQGICNSCGKDFPDILESWDTGRIKLIEIIIL